MNFKIFSIFDKVSGLYGNPFFAVNAGVAVRQFMEFVNHSYSGKDCQLYCIGSFDNTTGIITASEKPVFISNPVEEDK